MKKISVILPTYNRSHYIRPSIESVLNQTCQNDLEVVVADDCSSDNTEEVIDAINDRRILYLFSSQRLGASAARNRGVAASTGDWIAFIDSDTLWYPEKLTRQLRLLEESGDEYPLVYCRLRKQNKNGWNIYPKQIYSGFVYERLLFDNFIDTPSVLMQREVFDAVGGFDCRLPRFQDWDLFLRVAQHHKVIGTREVLFDSLTLADAISSNHKARLDALLIIFSKNIDVISENPDLYFRFLAKIINSHLILDQPTAAASFLKEHKNRKSFFLSILVKSASLFPKGGYEKLWNMLR